MAPLWPNWLLFQDQVPFLAHPWCFTIPPSSFRAVVFLLFFAMPQPRPISSTLEKNAAEFFSIRASTLGEWSGGRRPDSQRNAVVHGGSIAADIETIRWCEVFEQKYGVSLELLKAKKIPDMLRKVLNDHARLLKGILTIHGWIKRNGIWRRLASDRCRGTGAPNHFPFEETISS